ncbi:hypothetical protein XENOCAPTIV_009156 [Xenoophorus captivus]|uniref:Uncharacterized protein n=1 Tax=Xenoophorus captivus TaxID=1517983 RepID=A0ABV0S8I1_9TELE
MPQPCSGRRGDAPAEECRSPRRKRPRLERPSRLEMDSLRAEVKQLKALLKAPEPTPALQAAAAWESGEDLEDDGVSVRASNSEFQSLEDQRDPFPHPRDREGDPPSIGGNDGSGNSLRSSVSSGPGEEPCPLCAIILAALAKVDLDDAPVARPTGNPFFRRAPAAPPFEALISDDCRQSLRSLPVTPGQLFGPEAERALERRRQSSQTPEAWGGRSGAMGPPAPQPRRRDVREPRRQPTAGRFSQRRLAYWETHCKDVWVLRTMSQGYRLQFRRRPPPPSGVRVTPVTEPARTAILLQEIKTLLDKKAIVVVPPHSQADGFYYFSLREDPRDRT